MADEYEYVSKPLPDPGLGRFGLGDPTQFSAEGFFSQGPEGGGGGGGDSFGGGMDPNAITIPPSGYGGLPPGAAGDILFHNGTNWVVLARPSGKRVLMIDGGNPFWEETEAC